MAIPLSISGTQFPAIIFGSEGDLKISRKRMTIVTYSIIDNGVCRTAPATPGLLIRCVGIRGCTLMM